MRIQNVPVIHDPPQLGDEYVLSVQEPRYVKPVLPRQSPLVEQASAGSQHAELVCVLLHGT